MPRSRCVEPLSGACVGKLGAVFAEVRRRGSLGRWLTAFIQFRLGCSGAFSSWMVPTGTKRRFATDCERDRANGVAKFTRVLFARRPKTL